MTSITLPSFIRTIEDHCFENCQSLLKVTCKWESFEEIYSIGKYIFENIPSEAKLYVPKGTKNLYQSTEPWSNFKYIIEENSGTSSEMKKCETPTINYEYKKLTFTSGTEGAQFYYTIKDEDVKTDAFTDNGVVNLVAAYSIKAYASADGFENSDVAEAMLYFINAEIETTNINTIEQRGVLVTSDGQNITINGLNDGEQVTLYNLQGVMLSNDKASLGRVTLGTRGEKGVVILKTNSQTIKINLNK